jgi:hypothetical protein
VREFARDEGESMGTKQATMDAATRAGVLALVTAAVTAGVVPGGPSRAEAAVAGAGQQYFLSNTAGSSTADLVFTYGRADDHALVGDWDAKAGDSIATRRGATNYIANTLGGAAETTYSHGWPSDSVLVGDWDGNGADTLAVRRGNVYYVANTLTPSTATTFSFGSSTDEVLVGDWDGNGTDTLAVRRGNTYHVTSALGGRATAVVSWGRATDRIVVGDWNGDRKDTLGVRRGNTYYLGDVLGGATPTVFAYGRVDDTVLVGDWNGDGSDTLGLRRHPVTIPAEPVTIPGQGEFAVGWQVRPGLYRSQATDPDLGCYWDVASLPPGQATEDDVITGDLVMSGYAYAEVRSTDQSFLSDGCATWVMVSSADVPALRATLTDGRYRVGKDIAPGSYTTTVPADSLGCFYARVQDFRFIAPDSTGRSSSFPHGIAAAGAGTRATITIASGDVGVLSEDCGTWTKTTASAATASSADQVVVPVQWATRRLGARD